jgi:bleomycin hydrolase
MGANQSRPSDAAVNEKLLERLQALHTKDDRTMNEKDGFVVVGGEARMFSIRSYSGSRYLTLDKVPKYTPTARYQHDVSAATISAWEKELMEDPKVQQ